MKQSQCNAGGRHCARERGAWQPGFPAIARPRACPELRGSLKQFVEQCCVAETGSSVRTSEIYGAYKRWAVSIGKRGVVTQRKFESRVILSGVRIELRRPGGDSLWMGLRLKQLPAAKSFKVN